jgi:hypothetical protein
MGGLSEEDVKREDVKHEHMKSECDACEMFQGSSTGGTRGTPVIRQRW